MFRRIRAHLNRTAPIAIRRIGATALVAMTMTAAACGSDGDKDTTGPSESVAGTYSLSQIGTKSLPAAIYQGPAEMEDGQSIDVQLIATDGEVELTSNGRYTTELELEFRVAGQSGSERQSISDEGTYTRSGSTLTFKSSDPDIDDATASLDGDALSVQLDLMGIGTTTKYVYRRQ